MVVYHDTLVRRPTLHGRPCKNLSMRTWVLLRRTSVRLVGT